MKKYIKPSISTIHFFPEEIMNNTSMQVDSSEENAITEPEMSTEKDNPWDTEDMWK